MLRFSESVSFDARLAHFDIAGSKAHSAMLAHVGLISKAERDAIHKGLDVILAEIEAGTFVWSTKLEDVHMNIEHALTQRVPAAARLHTARSRNDQVATDMRLWFKHAAADLVERVRGAQRALLELATREGDVLIPGYTHLQRAQPVSSRITCSRGWRCSIAMRTVWRKSGGRRTGVPSAPARSRAPRQLPIDREFTAKALGFVDARGRPQVTQNSMDTVADRNVFIAFAAACATIGVHFSRMAEDLILWSSVEFKYADLPDAFCTGSSLMPQKKNPDSCELLRGKSARLQGNLHTLLTLTKGLPLTYNRDLQEDKPPVFDSYDQTSICLDVLAGTLAGMKVNRTRCAEAVADPALLATDLADYLVLRGVPFREAHHAVGAVVKLAEGEAVKLDQLSTRRTCRPCTRSSDPTG